MKKLISMYWQKILIAIGSCSLIYILISKFATKKTIIRDYVKYGKDVKPVSSEVADVVSGNISGVFSKVNPDFVKLTFFILFGIMFVVFLFILTGRASAGKDAKKK